MEYARKAWAEKGFVWVTGAAKRRVLDYVEWHRRNMNFSRVGLVDVCKDICRIDNDGRIKEGYYAPWWAVILLDQEWDIVKEMAILHKRDHTQFAIVECMAQELANNTELRATLDATFRIGGSRAVASMLQNIKVAGRTVSAIVDRPRVEVDDFDREDND